MELGLVAQTRSSVYRNNGRDLENSIGITCGLIPSRWVVLDNSALSERHSKRRRNRTNKGGAFGIRAAAVIVVVVS